MKRKYRVYIDHDGLAHLIKREEEEGFLLNNPDFFNKWLTDWIEYDDETTSIN